MELDELEFCAACGNHAVATRTIEGEPVKECEICGHLEGDPDLVELVNLQREADGLGVSIHTYPLAQFIDRLPGVKLQGDSGGTRDEGRLPFIAFELTDHRTRQLENLGQGLRLMRHELECEWKIEFTFEFELGFELSPRRGTRGEPGAAVVEAARRDLILMWRRMESYRGLAWWKQD